MAKPLAVITSTVDGDVLTALAGGDKAFTAGELHRLIAAHSESGIRKSLARLAGQGLVADERVANAHVYRLNRHHLAAPMVTALAQLRRAFLGHLSDRFASWGMPPVFAALFGSAARGDMRINSDIDVFVVRPDSVEADDPTWSDGLHALAADASGWTGNDVRVLEMSKAEARSGVESGDALLEEIRRAGVPLYGSSRILRPTGPVEKVRAHG